MEAVEVAMKLSTLLLLPFLGACFADPGMSGDAGSGESGSGEGSGEGSGGSASDESGSDGGSGSSDESGSGGDANWALEFDGDETVSTLPTDVTVLGAEYTIEFWLRTSQNTTGRIFDTMSVECCPSGWVLYQGEGAWTPTQNQLTFVDYGSADAMTWEFVAGPDLRALSPSWHHIAIVRSLDSVVTMFVDGSAYASKSFGEMHNLPGPFRVGNKENEATPLVGAAIDDIRISDVARYSDDFLPDEILKVDTDTAALWPLDDGQGESSLDVAGDIEMTILNATWVAR